MVELERARLSFLLVWTSLIFLAAGAAGGFGLWYLISNRGHSDDVKPHNVTEESSSQQGSTQPQIGTTPSYPWRPTERQKITVEEYARMSQHLWDLDTARLSDEEFQLSLQNQTNTSLSEDLAAQPLFANVNVDIGAISQIHREFLNLLNLYNPNTKIGETLTSEQWDQINAFVHNVLNTTFLKGVHEFLIDKGYSSPDPDVWRSQFLSLWFWLYPRSPKYNQTDSSGFEHVFVGERRGTKVLGFHSWIQTYMQEKQGDLDYYGYINYYNQTRLLNIQVKWKGGFKKQASMFLGTSPGFDLAVYTLCALSKIGRSCPIRINNYNISLTTWDVQHKPGIQIASAYPAI